MSLGVTLTAAALAWACTPQAFMAEVEPGVAAPGDRVKVAGYGFADGPVRIRWDGDGALLAVTSGPSFSAHVTVPDDAGAGVHFIKATGYREDGRAAGSAVRPIEVEEPPASDPPPSDEPPRDPPADPVPPSTLPAPPSGSDPQAGGGRIVLSRLRVDPETFAVRPRESGRAAASEGTSFRYRLSGDARVSFVIERRSRGLKVRGKCRPPRRSRSRASRCTRYTAVGSFQQSGREGANQRPFSGWIGGRALGRGAYRVVLSARDVAGAGSAGEIAGFRVTRAPRGRLASFGLGGSPFAGACGSAWTRAVPALCTA